MTLHLMYFAAVRDLLGLSEEDIEVAAVNLTLDELRLHLLGRHPKLVLEGVRIAVNEEFADDGVRVRDGDVVALIPPVAGG